MLLSSYVWLPRQFHKKSVINPLLFGVNCNWPENLYGKIGYNHPDAHTLNRSLQPSSLRFPHGVWSNFYDWETDGRRMTDDYKTPYDVAVKDHPDLKYGFEGFHKLNEKLRFEVLFSDNVNYDSAEYKRSLPKRPIWLSEWSVGCGENAISILGMADTYLGFIERPEQFEMADYFHINASHPLIHYDRKTKKHTRISYGAAFEIIREVFEGSEKLAAQTRSTKIGGQIDSVEPAAVEKDEKIVLFATNKTPRSVPFKLVVDGLTSDLSYDHQALSFDDINQLKTFELDDSVVREFPSDSGLVLPPLSLNRIELMK